MSADTPRVTVCVPVYNGAAYIAACIESILRQTYQDFRLIICDNCSTDDTPEIVREFSDPRIRYLSNSKNLGLVGNANRCLDEADGDYIVIFHHDDIMLPQNLEKKVEVLDTHPRVGFVHSNIELIDPRGEVVTSNIWAPDTTNDYVREGSVFFERYVDFLPRGASVFIGAVLARTECYKRLGPFRPELPHCNDSEMWMRMALFYDVACLGAPLVGYRVHLQSTSSSWGDFASLPYLLEHYLAFQMVLQDYPERILRPQRLRRTVARSFAQRALSLASRSSKNEDPSTSIRLVLAAARMSSHIFLTRRFWKVSAKIILSCRSAMRDSHRRTQ